MQAGFRLNKVTMLVLLIAGLLLAILGIMSRYPNAQLQTEKPYIIGIILSNSELPTGQMPVLKDLISHKLAEINELGGINGRPVSVVYIDDKLNDKKLYEMVNQTSQNPDLIAYVGCRGASRAIKIGPLITKKNIPLIGQYVFTHLTQNFPNMYTASVGTNNVKFLIQELLKEKATRIGFIGESTSLYSQLVQKFLVKIIAENADLKIPIQRSFPKGYDFKSAQTLSFLDSLKKKYRFPGCKFKYSKLAKLSCCLAQE